MREGGEERAGRVGVTEGLKLPTSDPKFRLLSSVFLQQNSHPSFKKLRPRSPYPNSS